MLWRVEDFKGIDSAQIDIRPGRTTVLTGANSSGKSSVIQSLLLVTQSLHSRSQVALNGPLVRLGDAQDIVREGSKRGVTRLTLGIKPPNSEAFVSTEELHAIFDLVPADDRSLMRARHVEIRSPHNGTRPFVMGRENSRTSDVEQVMAASASIGSREALHVKSLLESDRRQLRTYVIMQGLRPVGLVQVLDPEEIGKRYKGLLQSILSERQSENAIATNRSSYIREFARLLAEAGRSDPAHQAVADAFRGARSGNPYTFENLWGDSSVQDRDKAIALAAATRQKRPYIFLPIQGTQWGRPFGGLLEFHLEEQLALSIRALEALSESLDEVAERVQYLGPLRDEPRVVWNNWNELAPGLPVGTRGEYSAAVLSRFNSRRVNYHKPSGTQRRASLGEAVNDWLNYLRIGDTVAARSHGKLGVGLDLRVNGSIRDLTAVGVGVSQALPLLVGLLAAPEDALFIVEQPELHLHPAVQARLADFMITARPDLALLIETHSDAFVTRIRRRAAEGQIETSNVDIVFVEPTRHGSSARILEVSEYGDLSEWPEGFLSSAEEDVRAILSANLEKVSRNR